jgi:hypothetical protein
MNVDERSVCFSRWYTVGGRCTVHTAYIFSNAACVTCKRLAGRRQIQVEDARSGTLKSNGMGTVNAKIGKSGFGCRRSVPAGPGFCTLCQKRSIFDLKSVATKRALVDENKTTMVYYN